MTPEQLENGTVSFTSDVYSLGLVLYEMFTARRPFSADTRAGLVELHRDTGPSGLGQHVENLNPMVESGGTMRADSLSPDTLHFAATHVALVTTDVM